jgi:SAM-dependent methyltransferase
MHATAEQNRGAGSRGAIANIEAPGVPQRYLAVFPRMSAVGAVHINGRDRLHGWPDLRSIRCDAKSRQAKSRVEVGPAGATLRTATLSEACMISSWIAFWDSSHSIYVNARHKTAYYRLIGPQIAMLVPSPTARVLDYGSGEALHADIVASAAGELLLCDAAPRVRAAVAARFNGNSKIRSVSPEEVKRLPDHSVDFIVLHSVAQYLSPEEAKTLFTLFRRLIKPDGLLLVSDIIPPDIAVWTDISELLRFAAGNGFLLAALAGLLRNSLSSYSRMRTRLGLTRYGEAAMIKMLAAAGFTAKRIPENIGHHHARMAFITRPSS